ncbi:maltokinase [Kitasatospora sp. NPDC088391]|uniref:maltokinase N-terminal cap-like domain-containing protein n=1 Tax=Kitasatospora sp. NPDC088391 TaxID=3364074 RepID=UPI0038238789
MSARPARAAAAAAPGPAAVESELRRLLPDWLPRQRWYAAKGRAAVLEELAVTVLEPGDPALLHVLVRTGPQEWYQLLLGAAAGPPTGPGRGALPALPALPALRDGDGGWFLYEAAADPVLMDRLLRLLADRRETAAVRFRHPAGSAIPLGLPEHPSTAEQSNTSLVFGDRLMLKLLRRPVPGASPELELLRALQRAGDVRSAAPLGWMETAGGPLGPGATLGILQQFLPARSDGWELALERARAWIAGEDAPDRPSAFTAEARALGGETARVHRALAARLPTRVLGPAELAELAGAARRRLRAAAAELPELAALAPGLDRSFRALGGLGALAVQRVHGDLHLGQVLDTADGWVLIDFEGEPGRPVAERRLPQPALRDVAGMLRSFDYAARHALGSLPRDLAGRPRLRRRADGWRERNRLAFCEGYAAAGGPDPRRHGAVLRAMEADKAVYEAVYEAHNRPQWLEIPMAALRRLAAPEHRVRPPEPSTAEEAIA